MVPIYDTDLAEERWQQAEWRSYELWEKIELRARRRRWLWMFAAFIVFVLLSAMPGVWEKLPRWQALALARQFAGEIAWIKKQASIDRRAYRIQLLHEGGHLLYRVERSLRCMGSPFEFVRENRLPQPHEGQFFAWVNPSHSSLWGYPGILDSYCYSPYEGSSKTELLAFAIIPKRDLPDKDLTNRPRMDRVAFVFVQGEDGKIELE